ncbi:hypothetical protein ZWY2020_051267 [Hordeum vulgare]|nr:hypothetical protein ZWY2020_051267 [Hordeum vulgare]
MSSAGVNAMPAADQEEQSLTADALATASAPVVKQGKGPVLAQQTPAPVARERKSRASRRKRRTKNPTPPPATNREELESREGYFVVLALPAPGAPPPPPPRRANAVSGDVMMDGKQMASSSIEQILRASVPPRREPWELEPGWV